MFMLVGCFLIDTSGYVRRAEKYIAEKYNNLAVEHVMVRGGKESGYFSAGYYYTYWKTVKEPIVKFFVAESTLNYEPAGKKRAICLMNMSWC